MEPIERGIAPVPQDADAVQRYGRALNALRSVALSPEETARVLAEIKEAF
jgi:hypothetical protein